MEAVRGFAARTAEGCFLLRTLAEHHLGRLAARCDEPTRGRLAGLKLRDWACGADGAAVAAQLISVLVTEHVAGSGAPSFNTLNGQEAGLCTGLHARAQGQAELVCWVSLIAQCTADRKPLPTQNAARRSLDAGKMFHALPNPYICVLVLTPFLLACRRRSGGPGGGAGRGLRRVVPGRGPHVLPRERAAAARGGRVGRRAHRARARSAAPHDAGSGMFCR